MTGPMVVTGCNGQLGSELCRQWGSLAVGLDLPEFDLTDELAVLALLTDMQPPVVINTAAYTLVDQAQTDPDRCRAINVDGVAMLARMCADLGSTLVQISTDYVFDSGPATEKPYRETDVPTPRGVYARSKWEAEQLVAAHPRNLIVRTCGLYGRLGERSTGNFVTSILQAARQDKSLRVINDQRCTPTYVPHLAMAIRFLVEIQTTGRYHVTNAGETTWYGFAREILDQAGLDASLDPITTAQWNAPALRPMYSVLDCSKYYSLPNAPSMPHWREALRAFGIAACSDEGVQ